MTKFEELQQAHQHLLDRIDDITDKAAFVHEVQDYVTQVCNEAADVPAPRDRDQLRANLRYWASYLYDATGTYPNTTMRPARPTPPPSMPTASQVTISAAPASRRWLWRITFGIAALAALAILVAAIALAANRTGAPAPSSTVEVSQPDRVATQVIEQMIVNATMTQVVAASSTPTPRPTETPSPTKTLPPTLTPTAPPTPTPTAVIVMASMPMPPTEVPVPETVPLDVGYQILTQGPSPFDATVWVMQLKLVGIGGTGIYIYWVDGRQLSGDEYTVQGAGCESQKISIGVTSNGQAVKRDVSLPSPLAECLATPTP